MCRQSRSGGSQGFFVFLVPHLDFVLCPAPGRGLRTACLYWPNFSAMTIPSFVDHMQKADICNRYSVDTCRSCEAARCHCPWKVQTSYLVGVPVCRGCRESWRRTRNNLPDRPEALLMKFCWKTRLSCHGQWSLIRVTYSRSTLGGHHGPACERRRPAHHWV